MESQPLALALFGFRTPPASRVTLSTTNQNELYYMIPTLKTIPTSSAFLWALSLKVYYVSAAGGAILEVTLAWGGEGEGPRRRRSWRGSSRSPGRNGITNPRWGSRRERSMKDWGSRRERSTRDWGRNEIFKRVKNI